MISITNLTVKQKMICEVLWELDSKDQVFAFIKSLPKSDRPDAIGLYHLMLIECLDQELDFTDLTLAKQVIDRVR